MPLTKSCSRCGAELRAQSAEGFCVRCLLEGGLEDGLTQAESAPAPPRSPPQEGRRCFGDYELLEEIARGGMGVIYQARQLSLGRIVAVKMILGGQFASQQSIQRFRREVTAAALLQHPNIVAIHDVGIHDDQHYFSMDYVDGQNLSQLVGSRPLLATQAARYVKLIAEAIHYAHGQGILHRDLKPSNVLIDSQDQPRITDFGLAKRLEGGASMTVTGQVLGSPNFMPPEQAGSHSGKVGRHSDVYGLGAILYHLLTGRPPFQAESFESVLTQVLNAEPVSPRLLNSSVPADLETICVKCLQKEPLRRYESAQELADELGRFLRDEPIHARPITRTERAWRWCRRKPALAGLGAATLLLLIAVAVGSPIMTLRLNRQRHRTDQTLYESDMSLAGHYSEDGDLGGALALLEAHLPRRGETDRRSFEWFYLWKLCQGEQKSTFTNFSQAVGCVAISPEGKRLAAASVGSPVQILNCTTGKRLQTLPESNVVSLAFAPDGQALGVGSQDQVVVWNLQTEHPVFRREDRVARYRISFSPVGNLLVLGTHSGLRFFGHDGGSTEVWDYVTNERKQVFRDAGGNVALSPRGDQLATGNSNHFISIWNVTTGQAVQRLPAGAVVDMTWSPDGRTLATSYSHSEIKLWDVTSGVQIGGFTSGSDRNWTLAFSGDGKSLAVGGTDQMIRLWDVVTLKQIDQFKGHGGEVRSIAFFPDGERLASGGTDKKAMLWTVHPSVRSPTAVSNVISRPIFSRDGRSVAAGTARGSVSVWDVETLQERAVFPGARDAVAFSEQDSALIVRGTNFFLKTIDVASRQPRHTVLRGPVALTEDHIALSPKHEILAVGVSNGTLRLCEAATGVVLTNLPAFSGHFLQLTFSPDGELLAGAGSELVSGRVPSAKIWQVSTRKRVAVIAGHTETVLGAAFSPDGKTLATCGSDNLIKLWDTTTWKEIPSSLRHKAIVSSVAYSPNGRTLASVCYGETLKLWSAASRRQLAALKMDSSAYYITFSPDGQTIATLEWGNVLRLWRTSAPETSASRTLINSEVIQ